MRIVGGRFSGRRFGAPSGKGTRPTSDRVREALGSALQSRHAFDGAHVLDLFAGTGALSFEALSRGAAEALLIDRDLQAIQEIQRSAHALGVEDQARALKIDLGGNPALGLFPGGHGLIMAATGLTYLIPPSTQFNYLLVSSEISALPEPGLSALLTAGWIVIFVARHRAR